MLIWEIQNINRYFFDRLHLRSSDEKIDFYPTPCLIGKLIVQQRPSVVDRVLNLVRLLAYTTNAANGRRAE